MILQLLSVSRAIPYGMRLHIHMQVTMIRAAAKICVMLSHFLTSASPLRTHQSRQGKVCSGSQVLALYQPTKVVCKRTVIDANRFSDAQLRKQPRSNSYQRKCASQHADSHDLKIDQRHIGIEADLRSIERVADVRYRDLEPSQDQRYSRCRTCQAR